MKQNLFIFGAGGFGREVLSLVNALPTWKVTGFIDDHLRPGETVKGYPVLGGVAWLNEITESTAVVIALGDPKLKQQVINKITNANITFPVLIHPSVVIQESNSVSIGEGTIIGAGAVLTNDIKIGKHVLINLNATVGHDVNIGDYSSVMPGANIAGNVHVGTGVLIGAGSGIRNKISIADHATVGMGSVVVNDVDGGNVVVGVPAKKIR